MIPDPEYCGWENVNGLLQPHWFDGKEMPLQLIDVEVTYDSDSDEDEDEVSSDVESDYMSESDDD